MLLGCEPAKKSEWGRLTNSTAVRRTERPREKMMHQNFQSFGTPWETPALSSSDCVFCAGLLEYRSEGEVEVEVGECMA